MDHIRVVNRTGEPIAGRFNGVDYLFGHDKPLDVPIDAARHCFGFGQQDKTEAMHRLGWSKTNHDLPLALERLARVAFMEPQLVYEQTEDAPRKRGRKNMGDVSRPHGSSAADGSDGEGPPSPDDLDFDSAA